MKTATVLFAALMLASFAGAQTPAKPKVFVSAKGTENVSTNGSASGNRWFVAGHSESTTDAHDDGMEVTRDLHKECSGASVTFNQSAADYTVMLDRESKRKRSVFLTNSQVQIINRAGDVIGSNATRTVNAASKNACGLIMADWAQHGRVEASAAPAAQAEQAPAAAVTRQSAAPPATPSQGHVIEGYTLSGQGSDAGSVNGDQTSLGDAARAARAKKNADPTR